MKTMVNDIELIPTKNGCYDWNFGVNDLSVVSGNATIRNAVIHTVLLKPYELSNSTYANLGNLAYEYVKEAPTPHVKTLITEHIRNACMEISGVEDAIVEVTLTDIEAIVNITIIKENGEEVDINGITL